MTVNTLNFCFDRPETAGIDAENLMKGLSQLTKLEEEGLDRNYQVILSTAIDKYPETFKGKVFMTLIDDQRLLKKVIPPLLQANRHLARTHLLIRHAEIIVILAL
jgi:hypothetical protein